MNPRDLEGRIGALLCTTPPVHPDMMTAGLVLRASGVEVAKDQRDALLLAVRRGDEIVELELEAEVFRQSKTPRPLPRSKREDANARFAYFPPEELSKFAESFAGRPFLRDHNRDDLLAVGGEIIASELVEHRYSYAIRQRARLVKPWAVEAALDGTIRTFSIGWDPPGGDWRSRASSVRCTICRESLFGGACLHFPGDAVKVESDGATFIVEAEFRGAVGAESSAVSFPAVKGTHVDSIRQALSDLRAAFPTRKGNRMDPEQLKAMGLAENATPEQVAARVRELSAAAGAAEDLRTKLAAAEETRKAAQAALEAERKTRDEELAVKRKERVDALELKARGDGLWQPGHQREVLFRKLAARDLDEAEEFVRSLEGSRVNPVGQASQNRAPCAAGTLKITGGADVLRLPGNKLIAGASPKFATDVGSVLSGDYYRASDLHVALMEPLMRKLRLSAKDFAEHGPHAVDERDPAEPWLNDGTGNLDYRKGA